MLLAITIVLAVIISYSALVDLWKGIVNYRLESKRLERRHGYTVI